MRLVVGVVLRVVLFVRNFTAAEHDAYERHWLEQVRRGLALTPVQRLAWLDATMEELAGWVGRARLGRPVVEDPRQFNHRR